MTRPHLFTIGADFARTLARGLVTRAEQGDFALSDCIIYLPTRRAARGFGEAFAEVLDGAALLPQFRAIGDEDEEDILIDGGLADLSLAPAISPIRRRLLLAALIARWDEARGGTMNFAAAAALAQSLAQVMDEAETHQVSLDRLADLAPLSLAEHWREVTDFLGLIRDEWPGLLALEGRLNPAARRNAILKLRAARLATHTPAGMVIAAGSTGSIPATAALLNAIARLPKGAVILPGLDRGLDEDSWSRLDPGHPQFGLKQLLDAFGAERRDVADWEETSPARALLLRETLRPAPTTDAWRELAARPGTLAPDLEGLALVEANDAREEALVIALALRQTLETPERSAALVTPDRNLARRVAAELTRWGILIDDSAGRPLGHMSAGAFLGLLADAAEARFAPVPLLALLKHPFATLGEDPAPFRAKARELDIALRGPRPDPGLDGIARKIAHADPPLQRWWDEIARLLKPLETIFQEWAADLGRLIEVHVATAESLACKAGTDCPIWQGGDGEAAAGLMAQFREAAGDLPAIAPRFYPALLRSLTMAVPVRPRAGVSRAIAILGPLEARLQRFDLTILGGLNEGVWPAGSGADSWFSRPMRETLGLPSPERAIGLAAHDFAMLAAGGEVLLTRALKSEGAPTIASRWLQRMLQLCGGLGLKEPLLAGGADYLAWARALSEVAPAPRIHRPAPAPPVEARPRRLSVTEIEIWLRDPYAIYARHVLRLRPLDPLDQPIGALERGSALHRAMELFCQRFPHALPDDAAERLVAIADEVFAEFAIPAAQLALWRPRFAGAARWFVDEERMRRGAIAKMYLEVKGERTFPGPAGAFTLRGVADRIDVLSGGGAAILDYKTGRPPSARQVEELLAPQLPLEGAILKAGGFPGIGPLTAEELMYFRLSGGVEGGEARPIPGAPGLIDKAIAQLTARIAAFDQDSTRYPSRVRPFSATVEGDYDHLARVREWSVSGWSEE